MKILYLSCHEVLEYDELSLFTEIDATLPPEKRFDLEVYSLGGAYNNPLQSGGFMRSIIPHGKFYPGLYAVDMQCSKDRIHPELVEWADVILSMHNSKLPGQEWQQPWLAQNYKLFEEKKKRVVWRSIGQSTPQIEQELMRYRSKGMKIVRYSPIEEKIPHFAGQDAVIRFSKDPDEFTGWVGDRKQVITFAQSFKKRGEHLGFALWEKATDGFNRKVYGTENENLLEMNGGSPNYGELKQHLREARVFLYFGTQPAPYTLSLIEAMMTGVPVVAVGQKLRENHVFNWPNYEIPDIIQNGVNGYVGETIEELRGYIQLLLEDHETARRIGAAGRNTAIRLFDKKQIMEQWINFFKTII